jgi:2-hydroxy-dATP diphosphatase / coenzyme A diphosphatase
MNVNETLQEADEVLDTHVRNDESEVKEIIESIKEAQYFDASSMAPLTPASLVSISTVRLRVKL